MKNLSETPKKEVKQDTKEAPKGRIYRMSYTLYMALRYNPDGNGRPTTRWSDKDILKYINSAWGLLTPATHISVMM